MLNVSELLQTNWSRVSLIFARVFRRDQPIKKLPPKKMLSQLKTCRAATSFPLHIYAVYDSTISGKKWKVAGRPRSHQGGVPWKKRWVLPLQSARIRSCVSIALSSAADGMKLMSPTDALNTLIGRESGSYMAQGLNLKWLGRSWPLWKIVHCPSSFCNGKILRRSWCANLVVSRALHHTHPQIVIFCSILRLLTRLNLTMNPTTSCVIKWTIWKGSNNFEGLARI